MRSVMAPGSLQSVPVGMESADSFVLTQSCKSQLNPTARLVTSPEAGLPCNSRIPGQLPYVHEEFFEEGIEVVGVVYEESVACAIENL